jgi:hypothetical protein
MFVPTAIVAGCGSPGALTARAIWAIALIALRVLTWSLRLRARIF